MVAGRHSLYYCNECSAVIVTSCYFGSVSSNSQSTSPPNSSMVYSLLSGSSELDHPSTSGCSSGQPARLQTQRELLKALKELKIRMPADHRAKGRSSTLASLQYALNCVKQVRGKMLLFEPAFC